MVDEHQYGGEDKSDGLLARFSNIEANIEPLPIERFFEAERAEVVREGRNDKGRPLRLQQA